LSRGRDGYDEGRRGLQTTDAGVGRERQPSVNAARGGEAMNPAVERRPLATRVALIRLNFGLIWAVIAVSLLTGLARRPMYIVGLVISLLIWATAEGFGGPYTAGSTDLGTAITYAVVFALLFLIDDLAGRSPLAIDSWIEQRLPWWNRIARTPRGTA
jgi:hypothetical protein